MEMDKENKEKGEKFVINTNFEPEGFKLRTFFVNWWKILSWFLLTVTGIFICCMPWLAASFGLVLPTIFAGVAFPAMLTLGLIITVPSVAMMVVSILHICHKDGWAKLIKNITSSMMALAALLIGILLLAAPGLPIISAFAGMIGGLGSFGALLTKIALITLGACKGLDVVWNYFTGSRNRVAYGAIGNDVHLPFGDGVVKQTLCMAFLNLPKILRNLAIVVLGIIVCCKISLAVGLVFAIPSGLKLIVNFLDKHGNKRVHKVAKFLDNSVRGTFALALGYIGISFLKPTVLLGVLGKLSFITAAFPGVVGLAFGISLIAFGVLMLFKTVTDIICGDKEKLRQGACEIATSVSKKVQGDLETLSSCLDLSKKDEINAIVPNLIVQATEELKKDNSP